MPEPLPQSYENHRMFVPLFGFALLALSIDVVVRLWNLVHAFTPANAWAVVVGLALVNVCIMSRRKAQLMQDRIIRLETRLRLERLLGAPRKADIDRLTLGQLIALRFAGDDELPGLVDDVLKNGTIKPDDIKRKIKNWQADWLRV